MSTEAPSTHDKALRINIDASRYGTFAEIGAGQEVARWFFHVGGAAGTVAKTMSAYDMAVSDAIYGPTGRYVSRQRLQAMMDHEWALLLERLDDKRRGAATCFVFADTVTARSYSRQEEGHGWLGIRFQTEPRGEPSQIIIHARMWDAENVRQQDALGILGVNLIYGAFTDYARPPTLIGSLMDGLTRDRMEVDLIKLSGPAFAAADSRLVSLELVEQRLTNAAMFAPDGEVIEPAELLHDRPVLIERGSFRPVTRVTLDMIERAGELFAGDSDAAGQVPVALMEMTVRNLLELGEKVDHDEFLGRVDTLRSLGKTVMISNYSRFHNVVTYLRRYTRERIVMALGVPTLAQLFEEKHYPDLPGGVLEAMGRMLNGPVTLAVYPWRNARTSEIVTAESFVVSPRYRHLYRHLLENGYVRALRGVSALDLSVLPRDVLAALQAGDASWERMVPEVVVRVIKERKLFGLP